MLYMLHIYIYVIYVTYINMCYICYILSYIHNLELTQNINYKTFKIWLYSILINLIWTDNEMKSVKTIYN